MLCWNFYIQSSLWQVKKHNGVKARELSFPFMLSRVSEECKSVWGNVQMCGIAEMVRK